MVRTLTRGILTRNGYAVLDASDGEKALEIARDFDDTIDLLVTDVMMPRMSGPQLVSELRTKRPELRVLYMSGYAESSISTDGGLPKGVDLLQKPFSAPVLLERVREALDRPAAAARDRAEATSASV